MTMPPNPPSLRECVLYVCMLYFPFFLALMAQLCAAHAGVELLLSFFFLFAVCLLYRTWTVGLCVCNRTCYR